MVNYIFTPTDTLHPTSLELDFLLRHMRHDFLGDISVAAFAARGRENELAEGMVVPPEKIRTTFHTIHYRAMHAFKIAYALADLSQIPRTEKPEGSHLNIMLGELDQYVKEVFSNNKFLFTYSKEDVECTNFEAPIYMLLFNMVQNAIQYHKSYERPIVVQLATRELQPEEIAYLGRNGSQYRPADVFYTLSVENRGNGIPQEAVPRLFAPRDPAVRRGVGLSAADNICDLIHGYIRVRDNIIRGTKFSFSFPAERKEVVQTPEL